MTGFEIASLLSSIAISLGQIGIVWYGIRAMTRSSNVRAQENKRLAEEQEQRHAEAMTALKELIARTGTAQPAA